MSDTASRYGASALATPANAITIARVALAIPFLGFVAGGGLVVAGGWEGIGGLVVTDGSPSGGGARYRSRTQTAAAPRNPCANRSPTRTATLGANAQPIEATTNPASPTTMFSPQPSIT